MKSRPPRVPDFGDTEAPTGVQKAVARAEARFAAAIARLSEPDQNLLFSLVSIWDELSLEQRVALVACGRSMRP
jgi:hypothetical protein